MYLEKEGKMGVSRIDYFQFLLSSQRNYTMTNFADYAGRLSSFTVRSNS